MRLSRPSQGNERTREGDGGGAAGAEDKTMEHQPRIQPRNSFSQPWLDHLFSSRHTPVYSLSFSAHKINWSVVMPPTTRARVSVSPVTRCLSSSKKSKSVGGGRRIVTYSPEAHKSTVCRATPFQLDAWDANEIAGLIFGASLVLLAAVSPFFDDVVAREQRRELGLCEVCGGLGCDTCAGTGKAAK